MGFNSGFKGLRVYANQAMETDLFLSHMELNSRRHIPEVDNVSRYVENTVLA